jgi:glycosyltransferase involved in cell wall biosynthesis
LSPRIDRIVCVSEAVRQYFLGLGPAFYRMPRERPVTIHKGHDLAWYTAEPADLREFGLPENAFVVSCVANYRPHKGIDWLVRAMASLTDLKDVHLLLVGHMADESLSREIAASPAAERIHRLGYRENAPSIVAATDVFVLPSTRREGLARSLVEAMAYGLPAVTTDCGGNPELVANGETGLVVPVEDAQAIAAGIRRLHEDPALRASYGAAARERIRTSFNIETTIGKTHELYRDLVGG